MNPAETYRKKVKKAMRKNQKAVGDEVIVAALLQHRTISEAAQSLGLSQRTVYNRMKTMEFQMLYTEAKNDLLRKAVITVNEQLTEAINTTANLMRDPAVNAAVRLQAAQTIIGNAARLSDRLAENEAAARMQSKSCEEQLAEMEEVLNRSKGLKKAQ